MFLTHVFVVLFFITVTVKGNRQDFCQKSSLFFCRGRRHVGRVPRVSEDRAARGSLLIAGVQHLPASGPESCAPSHSHADERKIVLGRSCPFPGPQSHRDPEGKALETNMPGLLRSQVSAGCSQALSPYGRSHCSQAWLCGKEFSCENSSAVATPQRREHGAQMWKEEFLT